MEKIWLKNYPAGVPATIDVNAYESIRELFEESCAKYATRPAFTCMGKSITFAELEALSAAFGAWLQGQGCKKGARVALMMPNILQYPVCLFGALRAGCTVVNVNPLYTARELQHQLNDSGAEVLVVVENFAKTVSEVVGTTKVRQVVVTSIGELLGVKGILYFEMEARGGEWGGPQHAEIHGSYKAIVDSPTLRLVQALASLTSADGNTILVPGYYDGIRPPTDEEQRLINGAAGQRDEEGEKEEYRPREAQVLRVGGVARRGADVDAAEGGKLFRAVRLLPVARPVCH